MNTFPTVLNPVSLVRQMDRALDQFFGVTSPRAAPPVNVWEDEKALMVEMELPGFKIEQVEVTWERGTLTIRGARPEPSVAEGERYLHRERTFGHFSRSLTIAHDIDPEGVTATMTDGVLTVRLPKSAVAQPRRIPVSAN
jgi:HSP20 family molecular chaperone IbpA